MAAAGGDGQARACTPPEQEKFMERLARNESELAGLRADVSDMTAMVKRALLRRQEDREQLRQLLE